MQPMKKMHIAPMESISKPGERAPWLREGKWWRLLMIAGSLLVGAASSSHAQTLIWAPFSSDCSAASLGGGGATQYWHSSATPKNWCTSIGGSKSSWTDTFTALFPDNNGANNIAAVLDPSVPFKIVAFDSDTRIYGYGKVLQPTTGNAQFNVGPGKQAYIEPSINTGGGLEKLGVGTLTLLGTVVAAPFTVSGGTLTVGEGGGQGSLGGNVVIGAGATLKFYRNDSVSYNNMMSGTLPSPCRFPAQAR